MNHGAHGILKKKIPTKASSFNSVKITNTKKMDFEILDITVFCLDTATYSMVAVYVLLFLNSFFPTPEIAFYWMVFTYFRIQNVYRTIDCCFNVNKYTRFNECDCIYVMYCILGIDFLLSRWRRLRCKWTNGHSWMSEKQTWKKIQLNQSKLNGSDVMHFPMSINRSLNTALFSMYIMHMQTTCNDGVFFSVNLCHSLSNNGKKTTKPTTK